MARRTYTDTQRQEAVAAYLEHGAAEASHQTGIPAGTIAAWASRTGRARDRHENVATRCEAAQLRIEERRATLAQGLLDDIDRLRSELFAPTTKRQVVTLSGGKGARATAEIVDVDLDCPTFGDQKAIMTSIAIAVDKVQILSGGATQRTETIDASPEHVAGLVDELAERRSRAA